MFYSYIFSNVNKYFLICGAYQDNTFYNMVSSTEEFATNIVKSLLLYIYNFGMVLYIYIYLDLKLQLISTCRMFSKNCESDKYIYKIIIIMISHH